MLVGTGETSLKNQKKQDFSSVMLNGKRNIVEALKVNYFHTRIP